MHISIKQKCIQFVLERVQRDVEVFLEDKRQ